VDDLRVLIVAADPLARAGLARLIAELPGFRTVGHMGDGAPSADDLPLFDPHVIVVDLGWEPQSPLSLGHLKTLRSEGPPVVVLLPNAAHAAAARAAGATGLLRRDVDAERLAAALAAVAAGLIVLDPELAPDLWLGGASDQLSPADELTPRELEVLRLLAEGVSNRAIAVRLGISDHTVKFHVTAIMEKLGAQSRTDAVVRAARLGLIVL